MTTQTYDTDPKQKLYDTVKGQGLYTKSFDEFKAKYSTPEAIDNLYNVVSKTQLYTRSKDEFLGKYFAEPVKKKESGSSPLQSSGVDLSKRSEPLASLYMGTPVENDTIEPMAFSKEQEKQFLANKQRFEDTTSAKVNKPIAETVRQKVPKAIKDGVIKDKVKDEGALGYIFNTVVDGVAELVAGIPNVINPITDGAEDLLDNVMGTPGFYKSLRENNIPINTMSLPRGDELRKDIQGLLHVGTTYKPPEFDVTNGVQASDVESMAVQAPRQLLDMAYGAVTGGGSFFLQSVSQNAKELAENPEAEKLTPIERMGYLYTQGIVQAALEKFSLNKILKSTGLSQKASQTITKEIIDEFSEKGVKATAKEIQELAVKKASTFSAKLKKFGAKAGTSAGVEGITEGLQTAASQGGKLLLNKIHGSEVFNEADITKNFLKDVINSGVQGGAFGGVVGGGVGLLQNTNKAIREQVAQAQTPADIEKIRTDIAEQVELGNITQEESDAANITADQYAKVAAKIPSDVSPEQKYAIIGGIEQREGIKKEIEKIKKGNENLDPAFHESSRATLSLLEAKLEQTNDYLEGVIAGKKPTYRKEKPTTEGGEEKYYKTSPSGEETKITKEHYDLATAVREEQSAQNKEEKELSRDEMKAAKLLAKVEFPDTMQAMAEQDPIGTLKFIAEQAQGGRTDDMLRMNIPQEVINEAIAQFPIKESSSTPMQTTTEGAAENVVPSTSVIMPGEIQRPETTTITPKENVPEEKAKISIILPKSETKETTTQVPDQTKTTITEPNKAGEGAGGKGEGDLTGITHAQMNEIAEEFGLPTYEKDPQTVKEWDAEAAKRIKDNPNSINDLMNKMRNEGMPSPVEQRMMLQYIAGLRAKMRANPTTETLKELNRAKDISNIVGGRFVGQSLVARKGSKPTEDTLDGYLSGWTEAYGTETLPQEVVTKLTERFDKEEALKMSIEEAYQKGRDEALNAIAAEKVAKATKEKQDGKKDYKKERADLKEELKKATQEHRDWLKDQGISKSGIGFSLTTKEAKIIAKIAKSYAVENVKKLGELIEKVYEEIKDVFPEVTKNDIRDVLADVYVERKETRNELKEKWVNFKREASLLNQIEEAMKGLQKNKSTDSQIKATARIEELQKKLKEVQKLNKKKTKSEEEPVEDVSAMDETDLAKYKKSKLAQIENLKNRIDNKDYSEEAPPPRRIKLDREARKLEDQYEKMKEEDTYQQEKAKYDKLSPASKGWDKVWKFLGLKRIIQTAFDLSIPFRQNITTTINPLKWLPRVEDGKLKTPTNVRQFKNMIQQAFVPSTMMAYFKHLKETGEYHEMKDDGIVFSDPSELKLNEREEDFRNNIFQDLKTLRDKDNKALNLVSYIGEPIFASERAAAGALNTVRVERYRSARRTLEKQGITRENNPDAYKKMSEWVMNMTGRGKMLEMIEKSQTGKTLAGNTFYGARLFASRVNLLKNPFFSKMPKSVRKEAFKDMAGFVSGVALTGLALAAAGGKISFDPDDPEFLQVKFGNTKYDITGGMAAYIRTFLRLTKTAYKQVNPNVSRKEANDYSKFALRTGVNFVTNKFAPNTAYGYHFITGKTPGEEGFEPTEFLEFYPMYVDDIKDAWAEEGVSALLTIGLPNILGIGTQTYETKPPSGPSTQKQSKSNKKTEKKQSKSN